MSTATEGGRVVEGQSDRLRYGHGPEGTCAALACAADALLAQCACFLRSLPAGAFTKNSAALGGGTIGKHLRHTLDHFSAALKGAAEGGAIDYDHRERDVPAETSPEAALGVVQGLRSRLALIADAASERPVLVRVMISGEGQEAELRSTLGRELAFATHHALHHQAMMAAMARELGIEPEDAFGKAPSTVHHERGECRNGDTHGRRG